MTTIATLGPKGTFSHEAALSYKKNSKIAFNRTVWDVFDTVSSKKADLGIVPLENSLSGTVGLTIDALMRFNLNIVDELILPILHNLASYGTLKTIKTVYIHPVTYEQSERSLRKLFPKADYIETSSNGDSAKRLLKTKDKTKAAVIPSLAAKIYGLKVIKKNIQDNKSNLTKFIVISYKAAKRTGKDRTTITIYPQTDKPGLLYNLLGEFAKRSINLTKIESVPSKGRLGDYIFYIEFEGHKDDENVKKTLKAIESNFFLKVLGSYQRKY